MQEELKQIMGYIRTSALYYGEGDEKTGDYLSNYAEEKLTILIAQAKKAGAEEGREKIFNLLETAPRYLKGGTQVNQYFAKGWNEFCNYLKDALSHPTGDTE